jgi:hypothetical protein
MKRLLLLLIPLLFLLSGCDSFIAAKRGDFEIFNETQTPIHLVIEGPEISIDQFLYMEWSYRLTNHKLDCDYTLKVRNSKKPNDWKTFVITPSSDYKYKQYYIIGTTDVFKITSSTHGEVILPLE